MVKQQKDAKYSAIDRRAVMFSAALRGLSPLLGPAASNAIDMQNAAGVGINSMTKDKKPEAGSKAAQLSVFQVRPKTCNLNPVPRARSKS